MRAPINSRPLVRTRTAPARAVRIAEPLLGAHRETEVAGEIHAVPASGQRFGLTGYAKRPFAGPAAVLAYLSRYTHRVAISNSRLVRMQGHSVIFRWKDYCAKGQTRHKTMTLDADEFMRRFLLHVLPAGLHRIRHYGFLANCHRVQDIALARALLAMAAPPERTGECEADDAGAPVERLTFVCRHCGQPMTVVATFLRGQTIRAPPNSECAAS